MEKIDQQVSPTGLVTTSWLDDDLNLHVDYKQDIEKSASLVERIRNDGEAWRQGVKNSMVHAFRIEDGVVHELLKVGVNVYTAPVKDIVWGLKRIGKYEACDMTGKQLA